MKKFRFRLDKIRKLKEDRKKQSQRALAKALKRENEERRRLIQLRQEAGLRREKERTGRTGVVDPANLKRSSEYLGRLDLIISHQKRVMDSAAAETSNRRAKLKSDSREVKKYERLKELQQEQHLSELKRVDQKETDEIAGRRATGRGADRGRDPMRQEYRIP